MNENGGHIMSYRIILDSCGELTPEMKEAGVYYSAPLSVQIDEYNVRDDETFDQQDFLKKISDSPNCPKSSCPSPEEYLNLYRCEEDNVYVVTLSAELSGSYNSAVLGRNLYHEEFGDKNIYIINSCAASIGETLIAMKVKELEEEGKSFEEVIEVMEQYKEGQKIYFVLESLETLRKNGRLTGLKSVMASALNIKPVMSASDVGVIEQLGKGRGTKKALTKMIDILVGNIQNPEEKILGIAHCNCKERAEYVKSLIEEKITVKEIIINDTAAISSLYANDGGIIVAV